MDASTIITGWKVWTAIKPFKRWKERRQMKKRLKELGLKESSPMAKYRKLIVMAVGGALTLASRWMPGLEDADAAQIVDAAILLGTAIGVWGVPNESE